MSDDLISRKALLDRLRGNVLVDVTTELEKVIEDQPTAFDKEKVIEELKDMANAAWKNTGNKFCNSDMAIARHRALMDALEIVYKGGTK